MFRRISKSLPGLNCLANQRGFSAPAKPFDKILIANRGEVCTLWKLNRNTLSVITYLVLFLLDCMSCDEDGKAHGDQNCSCVFWGRCCRHACPDGRWGESLFCLQMNYELCNINYNVWTVRRPIASGDPNRKILTWWWIVWWRWVDCWQLELCWLHSKGLIPLYDELNGGLQTHWGPGYSSGIRLPLWERKGNSTTAIYQ